MSSSIIIFRPGSINIIISVHLNFLYTIKKRFKMLCQFRRIPINMWELDTFTIFLMKTNYSYNSVVCKLPVTIYYDVKIVHSNWYPAI